MNDEHYPYTKDEIKKNLVLLEGHAKNYPCPECVSKHLIAVEGLSEEGSTMTDDNQERKKFLELANWSRQMRFVMEGRKHRASEII